MRLMTTLLLLLTAASAMADDRSVAVDYLRARCATLAKGATAEDVDRTLAYMADDAVVEHPRFKALVDGKYAIRRGMLSHLPDYTGSREESGIEVLSSLEAPGVLSFRTRTTFVVGQGADRKEIVREGIMVIEVQGGLIVRVIEY